MAVEKNVSGQKAFIFAVDSSGNGLANDQANITAKISLDGASASASSDTNPTQVDATNLPGVYYFDLSQAETNADVITVKAASSTSGVKIATIFMYTVPPETTLAGVVGGTGGAASGLTVDQIRQFVTQILGEQMPLRGFVHSVNWVMDRIRARGNWSFWETEGSLAFPAQYSTGTLSVTQGSPTVTGSSTVWTAAMVGRQIRIGTSQYTITARASDTSVTIDRNWATDSDSGLSYVIYQARYTLAADVDKIIGMWDTTNQYRIDTATPGTVNSRQVWNTSASQALWRCGAIFGRDSSNSYYLYINPAPTDAADIVYWYHRIPDEVSGPANVPDIPYLYHRMLAQGVLARQAQNNRLPEWRDQDREFKEMMEEAWDRDKPLQLSARLQRADTWGDAEMILQRKESLVAI